MNKKNKTKKGQL